jgi:hypothetical protein
MKCELILTRRLPSGQGLCLYCGDKGPWHIVAHRLPESTVSTGGNDGDS